MGIRASVGNPDLADTEQAMVATAVTTPGESNSPQWRGKEHY